jgi:hypothetical protein
VVKKKKKKKRKEKEKKKKKGADICVNGQRIKPPPPRLPGPPCRLRTTGKEAKKQKESELYSSLTADSTICTDVTEYLVTVYHSTSSRPPPIFLPYFGAAHISAATFILPMNGPLLIK